MSTQAFQQIETLLPALSRAEKVQLVSRLAQELQKPGVRGRWKGKLPEAFDIDQALKEIRSEWEKEAEWVQRVERGKDQQQSGTGQEGIS